MKKFDLFENSPADSTCGWGYYGGRFRPNVHPLTLMNKVYGKDTPAAYL